MKIKFKVLFPIIFLSMLFSCKDGQKVKAKIFERKEIKGHKLMIKYKYDSRGQSFVDSATIENRVIANDTINVIIDPANPAKASPQLKK